MNNKNRIIGLTIGSILIGSLLIPVSAQAVLPNNIKNGTAERLGNYIEDNNLSDAAFTKLKDGTIVSVSMDSGINGQVNVVDIKNKKNLWNKPADNSGKDRLAWGHAVLDNGNVLISTSKAELFEVNPNTQEIKNVSPPKGIKKGAYWWELVKGDNNKVYVSSYDPVSGSSSKGGIVLEYDGNTGKWRDYGVIEPGAAYVRAIGYDNNKIYAGMGSGLDKVGIYQIDATTGAKKKLPDLEDYHKYNSTMVYYLTAHNGYLYVNINANTDRKTFVFNTKTWKWEEPITNSYPGNVLPADKNSDSILYRDGSYDIVKYNPHDKTKEVVFNSSNSQNRLNLSRFVDSSILGDNLIGSYHKVGNFYLYDLKTGKVIEANNDDHKLVRSTKRALTVLDEGTDNSIWVAPYFPTRVVRKIDPTLSAKQLNEDTGLVEHNHGQAQAFDSSGDWLVSTFYPSATIVATNQKTGEAKPRVAIKNEQTRPQRITKISDDLFAVSSDAEYGYYPGAISIYSLSQNKILNTFKNYGDTSPRSMAYKDGDYLYVGNTIQGGLGTTPKEKKAKIFKVNYKTGEIVRTITVDAEGVADLEFTPDGKLYALYGDGIARINPDDLKVEEYQRFSSKQGSMINELEYYNGYFIATINGNIYHIDPKDLSTRDLITQGLRSEVSNTTGDIYYLKDSEVYRWKLSDDVNDKPEPGKEKPGKEKPGKENGTSSGSSSDKEGTNDKEGSSDLGSSNDKEGSSDLGSSNNDSSSDDLGSSNNNLSSSSTKEDLNNKEGSSILDGLSSKLSPDKNNDNDNISEDKETNNSSNTKENKVNHNFRPIVDNNKIKNDNKLSQLFTPVRNISNNHIKPISSPVENSIQSHDNNETMTTVSDNVKIDTGSPDKSIVSKIFNIFS